MHAGEGGPGAVPAGQCPLSADLQRPRGLCDGEGPVHSERGLAPVAGTRLHRPGEEHMAHNKNNRI